MIEGAGYYQIPKSKCQNDVSQFDDFHHAFAGKRLDRLGTGPTDGQSIRGKHWHAVVDHYAARRFSAAADVRRRWLERLWDQAVFQRKLDLIPFFDPCLSRGDGACRDCRQCLRLDQVP